MSTYYEYRDVKVMIAHKLMKMEGWKVYGYKEDESDGMTDYYSPANWGGVAEKNGYILCVNVYGAREPEEIRKYNYTGFSYDSSITDKIKKLENMTVERGASEQEEKSAKLSIERLQKKSEESTENQNKYIVAGIIPGHQANPPRMNWHIEKDGIIIAKGNGILKYSKVDSYYRYSRGFEDLNAWKKDEDQYIKDYVFNNMHRWNDTEERAKESALSHIEELKKDDALISQFEAFINKLDTTCGGLLGEGDGVIYEKVTVTEYKKENKVFETENGEIKEGQCFILKSNFNYGCYKGLVYRIHETVYNTPAKGDTKHYHAYKLNRKLTKECTGQASSNNRFSIYTPDKFMKWINEGSISWCDITEVKTPYEVEKVVKKTLKVKKTVKAEKKPAQKTTTEATEGINADINGLTFEVSEDTDTRTNEKIYLVKVAEKLSREDYIKVNQYMKSIGGYYSRFKHGFIFKEDPTELLKDDKNNTNSNNTEKESTEKQPKQSKQQDKTKVIERINKAIESTQNKIDKLSGDYKTNTWKRMNEQANRDSKIEGYQQDINILQYLIDTLEIRPLTPLEENLITSSFRDEIDVYFRRNEAYNRPDRGSALTPIEFPKINYNTPLDGWWNVEVPKKQKRLQKANINNTTDLLKAVEEYKEIYNIINKPVNQKEKKIKQLEREYKMQQKGDINFTPSEVAKQLIEYARIDGNSRVLEPSAGIGNIADQIKQYTSNIDVCEQMYHFSQLLELKGYNVVGNDFLEYETNNKYDAIIMNPPFSDEQNHIKHAYSLLKDGGTLVSISSPHWTFANDRKSVEFREWLENETYFTEDLKSGTFEMTGVASKIIVIEKREQAAERTA